MRFHWKRLLIALPLVTAGLFLLISSSTIALGNLQQHRLATQLSFWGRDDYQPTEQVRNKTYRQARQLAESLPVDPDRLALAAYAQNWAWYFEKDPSLALQHAEAALSWQQQVVVMRPASIGDWATLARYAADAGREEQTENAKDRITALRSAARYNVHQASKE
jgi:hypothetical protein